MAATSPTGQRFSQMPQPVQRWGSTIGRCRRTGRPSRPGSSTSSNQMALGSVGHISSQTMHGMPMAHGRQRPRSTKAVPMRTGSPPS